MDEKNPSPWEYSSDEGYLTHDGKIRVFGFATPPAMRLTNARCAARQPIVMTLEPGRYAWCSCGYSTKQPFCDHAHCLPTYNTTRTAYFFEVLETCEVTLCRCKHTANPPFCDNTHTKVAPDGTIEEAEAAE